MVDALGRPPVSCRGDVSEGLEDGEFDFKTVALLEGDSEEGKNSNAIFRFPGFGSGGLATGNGTQETNGVQVTSFEFGRSEETK